MEISCEFDRVASERIQDGVKSRAPKSATQRAQSPRNHRRLGCPHHHRHRRRGAVTATARETRRSGANRPQRQSGGPARTRDRRFQSWPFERDTPAHESLACKSAAKMARTPTLTREGWPLEFGSDFVASDSLVI